MTSYSEEPEKLLVHQTPVEIWVQIFQHLLDDPIVFSPNPFYSGCNPHTAIREWNNYPRLRELRKQRRILRAVSRSWKRLADSYRHQYCELTSAAAQKQMHSASRLSLDSTLSSCTCESHCFCVKFYAYPSPLPSNEVEKIQDAILYSKSQESILTMSILQWDAITSYHQILHTNGALERVLGLEMTKGISITTATRLVDMCPRLVFLNLQFEQTSFKYRYSDPSHVTLPNLQTLTLSVNSATLSLFLEFIKMPSLQHIEITEYNHMDDDSDVFGPLTGYTWESLISLKCVSVFQFLVLPSTIWESFPALQYLGVSTVYDGTPPPPSPPSGHPLQTIANIDIEGHGQFNSRSFIATLLDICPSIQTVADSHCWTREYSSHLQNTPSNHPLRHNCHQTPCVQCVTDLVHICADRGLRYEDRFGRSWEEFKRDGFGENK